MMETMIPPQVGMRLRSKNKDGGGQMRPPFKKMMTEKERRDFATIFYHTCASKLHYDPRVESLMICHFHMLVGITYSLLQIWLVYSYDGLPQTPEVFMSKQVGCTPHLASFELSYTYRDRKSVV